MRLDALLCAALATIGCATAGSEPADAGDGAFDRGREAEVASDADAGSPDEAASSDDTGADDDDGAPDDDGDDDGAPDDGDADARPDDAAGDDADIDAGSLDPELSLPDPGGAPCTTPGSMGECPGIEVCRFYTPAEGRCESCSPCGNLGDPCGGSSECDILFMCYRGRCTNFCQLGTYMCGPLDACIDIGHPTWGVCLP